MRPPQPISFRQLCMVTRDQITADPSINDSEWRERIKRRVVALGFDYPPTHVIADAMDRVERAIRRAPQTLPLLSLPDENTPHDEPLSHDEARAALALLAKRFGPLPALKPRAMPAGDSDLMTTRERYALVHDIERVRTIHRLRKANAEAGRGVDPDAPPRDVPGAGDSAAEGQHEGLRAEVVGTEGGSRRHDAASGDDRGEPEDGGLAAADS